MCYITYNPQYMHTILHCWNYKHHTILRITFFHVSPPGQWLPKDNCQRSSCNYISCLAIHTDHYLLYVLRYQTKIKFIFTFLKINLLRPRQNHQHFADDVYKLLTFMEIVIIFINMFKCHAAQSKTKLSDLFWTHQHFINNIHDIYEDIWTKLINYFVLAL